MPVRARCRASVESVALYGQDFAFGPCADYAITDADRALFPGQGLECARLTVPLDCEDPGGRTAELGVLRIPDDAVAAYLISSEAPADARCTL